MGQKQVLEFLKANPSWFTVREIAECMDTNKESVYIAIAGIKKNEHKDSIKQWQGIQSIYYIHASNLDGE